MSRSEPGGASRVSTRRKKELRADFEKMKHLLACVDLRN